MRHFGEKDPGEDFDKPSLQWLDDLMRLAYLDELREEQAKAANAEREFRGTDY